MTADVARGQVDQDWRILRALSAYRLLLVIFLLLMSHAGLTESLFTQTRQRPFMAACHVYAIASLLVLIPTLRRWMPLLGLAALQLLIDSLAITALLLFSGGVGTGLGVLLITPTTALALILSLRHVLALLGMVSGLLFLQEWLGSLASVYLPADYTQVSLLSLALMGVAVLMGLLAQRIRLSEGRAQSSRLQAEHLAKLNEQIIEHLQVGVVVLDHAEQVILKNVEASKWLPEYTLGAPLGGDLAATYRAWKTGSRRDALLNQAFIPRFIGLPQHTLIFLDDAARIRQQAQQFKLAALGRLSAGVAHEIRNPLSAIRQAGQLLAESHPHPDDQRLLSMIDRHTERINRIVRDILSLSRHRPADRQVLKLQTWLLHSWHAYTEGLSSPRQMQWQWPLEEASIAFDPSQLQQVIFNLWDNAHNHGQPPVTTRVFVEGGNVGLVGLEVQDQGLGLPVHTQEKLFEPFFSTAHQGTGLGLYLAREICEYNQASLRYVPPPNGEQGAIFRLIFSGS